ncbi:lipoprotein signal peptidase [alpha proteobacterium U9-1i]|nr:lipoprotein signal peptidase [alpha proteobacterium U9-1i]
MPRTAGLVLIFGVIGLDLATKAWARAELTFGEPNQVLPLLDLTLSFNRGVAFGLMRAAGGLVVLLVTAAISLVFGLWFWREPRPCTQLGLALVLGGALGNFVDRLTRGEVTDFLDVHALGHHWPAFNLADTAITCGAVVLVIDMLRVRKEARP